MSTPSPSFLWPSSRDFVEAIQNPRTAFNNPELRDFQPALDRFGMPLVASGNFAYAFKLRATTTTKTTGVRCFRGFIPDRDKRYSLIDLHLNAHPTPALSDFDFEPEGITIAGRKYPIVLMEWIDGSNLDSYVEQVLGNKVALNQLADQWLKVIESLRASQVAHGDLQHGNIIVQNGQCRLIDLDGMFVPGMRGWRSSEIGHPHYQHPKRDAQNFSDTLDNFSAIVIYLSLIALAEAPALWKTYHDENLIFTKPDFVNPTNSRLFSEIRKLGQPHNQLCDVIERASRGPVEDTPYLLNLVTRRSKLPSWMMPQTDVQVQVKTREVKPGQVIAPPVPVTTSVQNVATPQFSYLQSLGAPVPQSSAPHQPRLDWKQVNRLAWPRALKFGFWGLFLFWVWVPFLQAIGQGIGLDKDNSFPFVFWVYVLACIGIAYAVTVNKLQHSSAPRSVGYPSPPSPQSPTRPLFSSSSTAQRFPFYGSHAQTGNSVVASKIRHIYHRHSCEWVLKIAHRNRVNFSSAQDAIRRGHRPCKVCKP